MISLLTVPLVELKRSALVRFIRFDTVYFGVSRFGISRTRSIEALAALSLRCLSAVLQWLMGPSVVSDVELDDGTVIEGHGVRVERCRVLEQSGAAPVLRSTSLQ